MTDLHFFIFHLSFGCKAVYQWKFSALSDFITETALFSALFYAIIIKNTGGSNRHFLRIRTIANIFSYSVVFLPYTEE